MDNKRFERLEELTDFNFDDDEIVGVSPQGQYKIDNGATEVVIPNEYLGEPILYIKDAAFKELGLTKLTFSQGSPLKYIGKASFLNNKLTNIDFSNCSELQYISEKAFWNNEISEVNFSGCPELRNIFKQAFGKNTKIKQVDFSNNPKLYRVGVGAFVSSQIDKLTLNAHGMLSSSRVRGVFQKQPKEIVLK